jgi:hypothetical protein
VQDPVCIEVGDVPARPRRAAMVARRNASRSGSAAATRSISLNAPCIFRLSLPFRAASLLVDGRPIAPGVRARKEAWCLIRRSSSTRTVARATSPHCKDGSR